MSRKITEREPGQILDEVNDPENQRWFRKGREASIQKIGDLESFITIQKGTIRLADERIAELEKELAAALYTVPDIPALSAS